MRPYRPLSLKHPAIRRRLASRSRYHQNTKAPNGYTAKGVKVEGTFYGVHVQGTIEEQIGCGIRSLFRVKFSEPIPIEKLHPPSGPISPIFHYRKVDESGRPISETKTFVSDQGVEFLESMRGLHCLGERPSDGKLFAVAYIFRWIDLTIPVSSLKKSQWVELIDYKVRHVSEHGRNHAVQFVKTLPKSKSMVVWFAEPQTFWDIEDLIDLAAVHPSHIGKFSYFMPFDGYKVLYKAGIKMPRAKKARYAGKWTMELDPPIPLKAMADLLRQYHRIMMKDEPDLPVKSVWYTLMKTVMFQMAPIRYDAINHIRPMREDLFYGLVVPASVIRGDL
jgi:hypothetical protein